METALTYHQTADSVAENKNFAYLSQIASFPSSADKLQHLLFSDEENQMSDYEKYANIVTPNDSIGDELEKEFNEKTTFAFHRQARSQKHSFADFNNEVNEFRHSVIKSNYQIDPFSFKHFCPSSFISTSVATKISFDSLPGNSPRLWPSKLDSFLNSLTKSPELFLFYQPFKNHSLFYLEFDKKLSECVADLQANSDRDSPFQVLVDVLKAYLILNFKRGSFYRLANLFSILKHIDTLLFPAESARLAFELNQTLMCQLKSVVTVVANETFDFRGFTNKCERIFTVPGFKMFDFHYSDGYSTTSDGVYVYELAASSSLVYLTKIGTGRRDTKAGTIYKAVTIEAKDQKFISIVHICQRLYLKLKTDQIGLIDVYCAASLLKLYSITLNISEYMKNLHLAQYNRYFKLFSDGVSLFTLLLVHRATSHQDVSKSKCNPISSVIEKQKCVKDDQSNENTDNENSNPESIKQTGLREKCSDQIKVYGRRESLTDSRKEIFANLESNGVAAQSTLQNNNTEQPLREVDKLLIDDSESKVPEISVVRKECASSKMNTIERTTEMNTPESKKQLANSTGIDLAKLNPKESENVQFDASQTDKQIADYNEKIKSMEKKLEVLSTQKSRILKFMENKNANSEIDYKLSFDSSDLFVNSLLSKYDQLTTDSSRAVFQLDSKSINKANDQPTTNSTRNADICRKFAYFIEAEKEIMRADRVVVAEQAAFQRSQNVANPSINEPASSRQFVSMRSNFNERFILRNREDAELEFTNDERFNDIVFGSSDAVIIEELAQLALIKQTHEINQSKMRKNVVDKNSAKVNGSDQTVDADKNFIEFYVLKFDIPTTHSGCALGDVSTENCMNDLSYSSRQKMFSAQINCPVSAEAGQQSNEPIVLFPTNKVLIFESECGKYDFKQNKVIKSIPMASKAILNPIDVCSSTFFVHKNLLLKSSGHLFSLLQEHQVLVNPAQLDDAALFNVVNRLSNDSKNAHLNRDDGFVSPLASSSVRTTYIANHSSVQLFSPTTNRLLFYDYHSSLFYCVYFEPMRNANYAFIQQKFLFIADSAFESLKLSALFDKNAKTTFAAAVDSLIQEMNSVVSLKQFNEFYLTVLAFLNTKRLIMPTRCSDWTFELAKQLKDAGAAMGKKSRSNVSAKIKRISESNARKDIAKHSNFKSSQRIIELADVRYLCEKGTLKSARLLLDALLDNTDDVRVTSLFVSFLQLNFLYRRSVYSIAEIQAFLDFVIMHLQADPVKHLDVFSQFTIVFAQHKLSFTRWIQFCLTSNTALLLLVLKLFDKSVSVIENQSMLSSSLLFSCDSGLDVINGGLKPLHISSLSVFKIIIAKTFFRKCSPTDLFHSIVQFCLTLRESDRSTVLMAINVILHLGYGHMTIKELHFMQFKLNLIPFVASLISGVTSGQQAECPHAQYLESFFCFLVSSTRIKDVKLAQSTLNDFIRLIDRKLSCNYDFRLPDRSFTSLESRFHPEGLCYSDATILETTHPIERGKNIVFKRIVNKSAIAFLVEFDKRCQNEEATDSLMFNSWFEPDKKHVNVVVNDAHLHKFTNVSTQHNSKKHLIMVGTCLEVQFITSNVAKNNLKTLSQWGYKLYIRPIIGSSFASADDSIVKSALFASCSLIESFFRVQTVSKWERVYSEYIKWNLLQRGLTSLDYKNFLVLDSENKFILARSNQFILNAPESDRISLTTKTLNERFSAINDDLDLQDLLRNVKDKSSQLALLIDFVKQLTDVPFVYSAAKKRTVFAKPVQNDWDELESLIILSYLHHANIIELLNSDTCTDFNAIATQLNVNGDLTLMSQKRYEVIAFMLQQSALELDYQNLVSCVFESLKDEVTIAISHELTPLDKKELILKRIRNGKRTATMKAANSIELTTVKEIISSEQFIKKATQLATESFESKSQELKCIFRQKEIEFTRESKENIRILVQHVIALIISIIEKQGNSAARIEQAVNRKGVVVLKLELENPYQVIANQMRDRLMFVLKLSNDSVLNASDAEKNASFEYKKSKSKVDSSQRTLSQCHGFKRLHNARALTNENQKLKQKSKSDSGAHANWLDYCRNCKDGRFPIEQDLTSPTCSPLHAVTKFLTISDPIRISAFHSIVVNNSKRISHRITGFQSYQSLLSLVDGTVFEHFCDSLLSSICPNLCLFENVRTVSLFFKSILSDLAFTSASILIDNFLDFVASIKAMHIDTIQLHMKCIRDAKNQDNHAVFFRFHRFFSDAVVALTELFVLLNNNTFTSLVNNSLNKDKRVKKLLSLANALIQFMLFTLSLQNLSIDFRQLTNHIRKNLAISTILLNLIADMFASSLLFVEVVESLLRVELGECSVLNQFSLEILNKLNDEIGQKRLLFLLNLLLKSLRTFQLSNPKVKRESKVWLNQLKNNLMLIVLTAEHSQIIRVSISCFQILDIEFDIYRSFVKDDLFKQISFSCLGVRQVPLEPISDEYNDLKNILHRSGQLVLESPPPVTELFDIYLHLMNEQDLSPLVKAFYHWETLYPTFTLKLPKTFEEYVAMTNAQSAKEEPGKSATKKTSKPAEASFLFSQQMSAKMRLNENVIQNLPDSNPLQGELPIGWYLNSCNVFSQFKNTKATRKTLFQKTNRKTWENKNLNKLMFILSDCLKMLQPPTFVTIDQSGDTQQSKIKESTCDTPIVIGPNDLNQSEHQLTTDSPSSKENERDIKKTTTRMTELLQDQLVHKIVTSQMMLDKLMVLEKMEKQNFNKVNGEESQSPDKQADSIAVEFRKGCKLLNPTDIDNSEFEADAQSKRAESLYSHRFFVKKTSELKDSIARHVKILDEMMQGDGSVADASSRLEMISLRLKATRAALTGIDDVPQQHVPKALVNLTIDEQRRVENDFVQSYRLIVTLIEICKSVLIMATYLNYTGYSNVFVQSMIYEDKFEKVQELGYLINMLLHKKMKPVPLSSTFDDEVNKKLAQALKFVNDNNANLDISVSVVKASLIPRLNKFIKYSSRLKVSLEDYAKYVNKFSVVAESQPVARTKILAASLLRDFVIQIVSKSDKVRRYVVRMFDIFVDSPAIIHAPLELGLLMLTSEWDNGLTSNQNIEHVVGKQIFKVVAPRHTTGKKTVLAINSTDLRGVVKFDSEELLGNTCEQFDTSILQFDHFKLFLKLKSFFECQCFESLASQLMCVYTFKLFLKLILNDATVANEDIISIMRLDHTGKVGDLRNLNKQFLSAIERVIDNRIPLPVYVFEHYQTKQESYAFEFERRKISANIEELLHTRITESDCRLYSLAKSTLLSGVEVKNAHVSEFKMLKHWEKKIIPKILSFVKGSLAQYEIDDFFEQIRIELRRDNNAAASNIAYILCDQKLPNDCQLPQLGYDWSCLDIDEIKIGQFVTFKIKDDRFVYSHYFEQFNCIGITHLVGVVIFKDLINNCVSLLVRDLYQTVLYSVLVPQQAIYAIETPIEPVSQFFPLDELMSHAKSKFNALIRSMKFEFFFKEILKDNYVIDFVRDHSLIFSIFRKELHGLCVDEWLNVNENLKDLKCANPTLSALTSKIIHQGHTSALLDQIELEADRLLFFLNKNNYSFDMTSKLDVNAHTTEKASLSNLKNANLNIFNETDEIAGMLIEFKSNASLFKCSGIKFFDDSDGINLIEHIHSTQNSELKCLYPLVFNMPDVYYQYYYNADALPTYMQAQSTTKLECTVFAVPSSFNFVLWTIDIFSSYAVSVNDHSLICKMFALCSKLLAKLKGSNVVKQRVFKLMTRIIIKLRRIIKEDRSGPVFATILAHPVDLKSLTKQFGDCISTDKDGLFSSYAQDLSEFIAVHSSIIALNGAAEQTSQSTISEMKELFCLADFLNKHNSDVIELKSRLEIGAILSSSLNATHYFNNILLIEHIPAINFLLLQTLVREVALNEGMRILVPEIDIYVPRNSEDNSIGYIVLLFDSWEFKAVEEKPESKPIVEAAPKIRFWSCEVCTLLNEEAIEVCSVCETAKPVNPLYPEECDEQNDDDIATEGIADSWSHQNRLLHFREELLLAFERLTPDKRISVTRFDASNFEQIECTSEVIEFFMHRVVSDQFQKLISNVCDFIHSTYSKQVSERYNVQSAAQLHQYLTDLEPIALFKELACFGIDFWLEKSCLDCFNVDPLTLIKKKDIRRLIQFIGDDLCDDSEFSLFFGGEQFRLDSKSPMNVNGMGSFKESRLALVRLPQIISYSNFSLRLTIAVLQKFNALLLNNYKLLNLAKPSNEGGECLSLGVLVVNVRDFWLRHLKLHISEQILHFTSDSRDHPPKVLIERLTREKEIVDKQKELRKMVAKETEDKHLIFIQAFRQLSEVSSVLFRPPKPKGTEPFIAFEVVFKGENVMGEGGPYRQFFSDISSELQPVFEPTVSEFGEHNGLNGKQLNLFISSPNRVNNIGDSRDKFVINPSKKSTHHLHMYEFIGFLMGCAFRTNVFLSFNLPTIFWKKLTNEKVVEEDIEEVDKGIYNLVSYFRASSPDELENDVFQNFTILLSDNTVVELVPSGANIKVNSENKDFFVSKVLETRFNESDVQINAIKSGFTRIVPEVLLNCLNAKDLEKRICGNNVIDFELLKKHTRYSGHLKEDSQLIRDFWCTLNSFSNPDKQRFVKFCWGQERLPSTSREFENAHIRFMIKPSLYSGSQDGLLPRADTCFFNFELPHYSNIEIMKEKILLAIHTDCDSMNAEERKSDDQKNDDNSWVGESELSELEGELND